MRRGGVVGGSGSAGAAQRLVKDSGAVGSEVGRARSQDGHARPVRAVLSGEGRAVDAIGTMHTTHHLHKLRAALHRHHRLNHALQRQKEWVSVGGKSLDCEGNAVKNPKNPPNPFPTLFLPIRQIFRMGVG